MGIIVQFKIEKLRKKIKLTWPVLILPLLFLAGCGFGKPEKSKEKLNYLESKIQESASQESLEVGNIAAFENAINAKDYEKLEVSLATEAVYSIEGEDCCGKIAKTEIISRLKEYLADKETFNFSQSQENVKKIKSGTFDKIENYTIGINGKQAILAYKVNADGKINNIYINQTCEFLSEE